MTPSTIEHTLKEKARVGRVSQIRELVFGAQDGLLVPLGVISSVAGAFSNNHIVIVAGISEALAGAFSMATGAFLSSQAESQVHRSEINRELAEIQSNPDKEHAEMVTLFMKEDMPESDAKQLVAILKTSPTSFAKTMIQKELGIEPDPAKTPIKDALFVGFSYIGSALVPLFPYFFWHGTIAIVISILATFLALFSIGLLKGKLASLPILTSGLQVLAVGTCSGFGGYILGTLLPRIFGA